MLLGISTIKSSHLLGLFTTNGLRPLSVLSCQYSQKTNQDIEHAPYYCLLTFKAFIPSYFYWFALRLHHFHITMTSFLKAFAHLLKFKRPYCLPSPYFCVL